jgi:hypothetical protein
VLGSGKSPRGQAGALLPLEGGYCFLTVRAPRTKGVVSQEPRGASHVQRAAPLDSPAAATYLSSIACRLRRVLKKKEEEAWQPRMGAQAEVFPS